MADTKGISVQVPVDLHAKVKAEQDQLELTMSEYIQQVLEEHFTPKSNAKGGNDMSGSTRTLAFQVSEELFQRIEDYLSKHRHLTKKRFVVDLIEAELNQFEALEARIANRLDARDGALEGEGAEEGGTHQGSGEGDGEGDENRGGANPGAGE